MLFFSLFSTSRCMVLFAIILLLRLFSLVPKSIFVTKSACANLPVKTPAAKLLNSRVVMYLS